MKAAAQPRGGDFALAGPFGRDRGLSARQLDLSLWPRGTVQEVLAAYFRSLVGLSEHSIGDYRTREGWLMRVLGPATDVAEITVETLARIARIHGPDGSQGEGDGLMYVTITKRFKYLRSACEYAAARKVLRRDDVPTVPNLPDDGRRLQRALTLGEFRKLELALPDRFRRFAVLGYFTGQHSHDIFTMTHGMLDPDFTWVDDDGSKLWRGRFWRRNHKVPDCEPMWLPMEVELWEAVKTWRRRPVAADALVVGRLWALKRNFDHGCDAAGIERATPNRDMRRSFASMLLARGYGAEYVRQALGHLGPVRVDDEGKYAGAAKSTVGTQHYFRMTEDLIRRELRRRRAEGA